MSVFPRIDPNHPLTEAARQNDEYAEEHGLPGTLEWLGVDVGPGEVAYLGEQRALRAIAASKVGIDTGVGLGTGSPKIDEETARAIILTPLWRDMRALLIACYIDGMAIGWKAHEIAQRNH